MTTRLTKPVRRLIDARASGIRYDHAKGTEIVVEISAAGVSFREKGRRFVMTLPWRETYRLAEHYVGDQMRQEKLRDAAIARHVGLRRVR